MTSTVTVEEYLVYPYNSRKLKLVDNFKRFIQVMNIEVINIDSEIAEEGAKIRSRHQYFKGMAALQIATPVVSRCDMFFTNDKQLRQEKELPCVTVDELKSKL